MKGNENHIVSLGIIVVVLFLLLFPVLRERQRKIGGPDCHFFENHVEVNFFYKLPSLSGSKGPLPIASLINFYFSPGAGAPGYPGIFNLLNRNGLLIKGAGISHNSSISKSLQNKNGSRSVKGAEKSILNLATDKFMPYFFHFKGLTKNEVRKMAKYVCYKSEFSDKEIRETRQLISDKLIRFRDRVFLPEGWIHMFEDVADGKYNDVKPSEFDVIMLKYLKKGMRIASVGCGGGKNLFIFADRVGNKGRVYAVDIDPNIELFINLRMIKKYALKKRDYSPIIYIVVNNFNDMRRDDKRGKQVIADESLDVIHMEQLHIIDSLVNPKFRVGSIKEYNDRLLFTENAVKSLKPGGILFLYEGHRGSDDNVAGEVRKLLKERYNCVEILLWIKKIDKNHAHQVQVFKKL